ncbi:MAG: cyclopropane fatty acyl phospholipid synthase [Candidatus Komeilibacteria bacterium]|nr:cyclopropane fatty acyl phospholipid synthase [Candidatus Komeilibacteria bacterium]
MSFFKQKVEELLNSAGISINGSKPWDIQVNNSKLYRRLLLQGALGLGESYMDGWWDCQRIDMMVDRLIRANLHERVKGVSAFINLMVASTMNLQSKTRAFIVGQKHYDIGNDLYGAMLDEGMNYSCAYWQRAQDLNQAQVDKLDLCCRKLKLRPGMKVLDIGCGWGGFAFYAAANYGASVHGITISQEQVDYCNEHQIGNNVTVDLKDYRSLHEEYDAIISIGMFEHVGYKNYRQYMEVVHRCLKPDGLFLLHSIGGNKSVHSGDPWTEKYIFTNSMLPSIKQTSKASEGLFVWEDVQNFGAYYDKTLMAWYDNFRKAWPALENKYGYRFYRMWAYYLLSCAGSFRSRKNQLWQIVLAKGGVDGVYQAER